MQSSSEVPTGSTVVSGLRTRADDRDVFVCHRLAVHSAGHIDDRLDVVHQAIHGQGNSAWWDPPPRNFVDQDVLIARRIDILIDEKVVPQRCGPRAELFSHVRVLLLHRNRHLPRSGQLLHDLQSSQHLVGLAEHGLAILLQQRFAFGAVGDDVIHAGFQLPVGGKPRPSSADNSGLAHASQDRLILVTHGSGPHGPGVRLGRAGGTGAWQLPGRRAAGTCREIAATVLAAVL